MNSNRELQPEEQYEQEINPCGRPISIFRLVCAQYPSEREESERSPKYAHSLQLYNFLGPEESYLG